MNDAGREREDVVPLSQPGSDGAAGVEDDEDDGPIIGDVIGAGIDWTDPNSPLAPVFFQVSHVLFALFVAGLFALLTHIPLWHTDVWAHLRFGEEIVRLRSLPEYEPFPESFADKESKYIHYQWLAQVGAYLVFRLGEHWADADPGAQLAGGAALLSTVHALVVALRLVFLWVAFRRLTGSPTMAGLGACAVAIMGMFVHLPILRPQILGELAFAALLVPLSRPVLSRRALVLMPLVFLFWANCHGSFAMGFVLLGAALVGQALDVTRTSWSQGPRATLDAIRKDLGTRRLFLVCLLSAAAASLNPHGPALLWHGWRLAKHPNIAFMDEWKPLGFRSPQTLLFALSVGLLAFLLRRSKGTFRGAQVLLLLGFGLQSVAHARYVVWWCMVFVWAVLPHLHTVMALRWPRFSQDSTVASLRKTVVAMLMVVVFGGIWSAPGLWWLHADAAPRLQRRVVAVTPVQAAETLRARHAAEPGTPLKIFASETQGDYLLWALRGLDPPVQISCYTHLHLLTEDHWTRCWKVKNTEPATDTEPGWEEILDGWGIQMIVLEYDVYEQQEHRARRETPGMFNLIDKLRRLREPDGTPTWVVLSERPIFLAERSRRR